ncbi:uncharacterized protein LOC141777206 [Sebastes fasciatus]|uniref:uncharacterized protein LOC141777206 n=1 Tax=Sebastes fasciatus TaxID=394691 RepID=UPI003D9E6FB5
MCSVVGCVSGRLGADRFRLPEDPERRLEWVQFLAAVNKQRFKEASWTDITICSEHFKEDCFEKMICSSGVTVKVQSRLNPSAVPSLCLQSETHLERPTHVEPEETTEVDQTSMAAQGSPVPLDAFISVPGQMQPKNINFDLIREKAGLLHMKGKYVVNEKCLFQLFSHKCPSCGSKVKMEKVTYGVLIILNQQCPQCDYRNQWKSQINASVPGDGDQHLTEVKTETQQAVPTGFTGVPEIVAVIDEEMDDPMDELSDQGVMDSDEDWKPKKGSFHARMLKKIPNTESKDEDGNDDPPLARRHGQLCTECGKFFNNQWPHTCEHKIKPYSCNICGKRCVSENALRTHSRIHDENYEFRCKYCEVKFKRKADKMTHQQIHLTQKKPFKCPDCSETFATNQQRKIHLDDHRGPQQLKCHICGVEFLWPLCLQRHLSVHTGARPFKCSVCQRGFSQGSHLKSHMRLHTGERPFKCQLCDERFNHNVSLKSHVQRYHSSSSGREEKKENESDTLDVQENGNKRGSVSGLDNVEEEHDKEEEVQEERKDMPKCKKRSTGRPKGRPKSYEPGNSVEGQCSNTETVKQQSKRTKRSDEESEDEPSDTYTSFDSAEEEEESCKKAMKNTARSRGRPKHCDSDSDFDPAERKKKRYSSGKRRGTPRTNVKEES